MDVVRALHFADLHLGVEAGGRPNPATGLNQRVHDVLARLDEVCACVEQEDVHLVVFAGDAFKHQHPTPTLQSLFAARMRRLARAGARVFLLVGNHDLPRMASLAHPFSIYSALEVEGVVVGDRAQVYRLDVGGPAGTGVQVAALPHFSRHQVVSTLPDDATQERLDDLIRDAVEAQVRAMASEIDASAPAVFAGHCHVNQARVTDAQQLFGVSDLEVTMSSLVSGGAFPYYALGHLHSRQVLSSDPYVVYSGSLERVDFGEGETFKVAPDGRVRRTGAEAKGFYRFDLRHAGGRWELDGEPSFRPVAARRFVTVTMTVPADTEPNESVVAQLGRAREAGADLTDAFVKLHVTLEATDRARLRYRVVKDACAEAYDVRVSAQAPDDSMHVRDPRFAARMAEAEALERYLETKDEWADDLPGLLAAGRALIEEVLA